MKKSKFFTIAVIASIFFTACGGSTEDGSNSETNNPAGSSIYETDSYSITIPSAWETIGQNDFTSNVPGETVVGFRNNIKNEIFTANINISQKETGENLTAEDFGKSTIAALKTKLISFSEINNEEKKLSSGEPAYFIEFEGKQTATSPIVHFQQYFIGNNVYILTAAYLANEDETVVTAIDDSLNSFTLK
ncbi:hypothetical protein HYW82_02520 [Candidatus Peregrinibacteria bacterium]|nr:hypothetical protein [Candidatus Peregrinibacteria bacterium]